MQVRVKEDSRFHTITALGGMTFLRTESVSVDKEFKEEVERNPYLEIVGDESDPALADAPPSAEGEINATDGAIALAEESGVDLIGVEGSGKEGRIGVPDIRALIEEG